MVGGQSSKVALHVGVIFHDKGTLATNELLNRQTKDHQNMRQGICSKGKLAKQLGRDFE